MSFTDLPTPCYVVDEARLQSNLDTLKRVADESGAHILLAQKAFSGFHWYPLIGEYLSGCTASGLFEARLGREEMGKENHIFSPAYREDEFDEIVSLCDHIVFNSPAQFAKFQPRAAGVSCGLRVNPECSTQEGHAIYDPCARGSRLGATRAAVDAALAADAHCLDGLEGIHFHTLCEQNSDALETTLDAVEERFGDLLDKVKWVNFGGGHHITRADYDIARLERCIRRVRTKYGAQVYLEPGEAVALNAGYLVTTVLDVVENGGVKILILDASAACHMPDVIEMPYRPPLRGAGKPGEKPFTYRLASATCLAGDVIGDYSFDHEIRPGERLTFEDMAIYSMVKNNTFNGMALPAIAALRPDGDCEVIRRFNYHDFKNRLS